ncbi:MAG: urea transporter [Planctomycetes bacterium]|nr:urea transporter [Planctomycetota bacterium]
METYNQKLQIASLASSSNIKEFLRDTLRPILNSYSEIFFLQSKFAGFLILLISCLNPHLGGAGFLAIVSAYLFALFMGYQKEFMRSGYYTYNTLLVGMSIGSIFSLSALSVPFIMISGILTFVITVTMANVFYQLFKLHILSIPFVIVSSLIYLAASRFSNLYTNDLYMPQPLIPISAEYLPQWLAGFLTSLGSIIFMPDILSGILIALMIGYSSRILLLLAFGGFILGTLVQGSFTGSYDSAFRDVASFNYILIAIALGGVFNIPCMRSLIIASLGVAMATVLIKSTDVFWAQYNIPVFTLPFTVITLSMNYALGLLGYEYRPIIHKDTPEKTTEYYYTAKTRYPASTTMHLPFLDTWTVWQGFNGTWTHQGLWSYAYDFVQTKEQGKTHANEGKLLSDYHCYQKEVCSPVRGYVVYTMDHFPDNSIGMVDTVNNWGNYIIIQDLRGYYVSLCHLSHKNVYVKAGDWVEPYTCIALCGNSGYSPQPHLHMQYQTTEYIASATIPFCFSGLLKDRAYHHFDTPQIDAKVSPAFSHAFYHQVTNFLLDEELKFKVTQKGRMDQTVTLITKMAVDGTFFLEHNGSRLYLGKTESTFYFYHLEGNDSILSIIYKALPSMPLNYAENYSWKEHIPLSYITNSLKRDLAQIKRIFTPESSQHNAQYKYINDHTIEGEIHSPLSHESLKTRVTLDPHVKFKEITVGQTTLSAHYSSENT